MDSSLQSLIRQVQNKYRYDPAGFNTDILGRLPYWSRQEEICRSIIDYRVTVAFTGNATGKDYLLGGIIPWWGFTRLDSLVIVTGVSQTVLGSVTWKEVRRAIDGSKLLRMLGVRVSNGVNASPLVVEFAPGWHCLGYSTTNVERASGQHAPELLAIMNEASGIPDDIYDAIDSLKYQKLLVFGNPIRADGRFVGLIRQAEKDRQDSVPKHKAVNAIQIPSTDSPHAGLDESPFGLADKTWLEDMYRRYGKDSLWVKSHIKAEIPEVSADALIPESWLDWAATRDMRIIPELHPINRTRRISCDLGEGVGRDSSAVVVRDDWRILDVVWGSALGLPEAAEAIAKMKKKWGVPDERISYDRVGIGRSFPLHLQRRDILNARGYAGAASPRSGDFTNLRTEAAWRLRLRLDPSHIPPGNEPHATQPFFHVPAGPYWHRLREELRTLTYDLVGRQTRLLAKDLHCEALGHSPDLSDALIQSFAFI